MKRKYKASRISKDNKLFPPSVTIEDGGLRVVFPGFFSGQETFVSYNDISSISVEDPVIGFTKLHINIRGQNTTVAGFYKSDANAIKKIWEEKRKK